MKTEQLDEPPGTVRAEPSSLTLGPHHRQGKFLGRRYEQDGLLQQVAPGVWEWLGGYHPVYGLSDSGRTPDELVI